MPYDDLPAAEDRAPLPESVAVAAQVATLIANDSGVKTGADLILADQLEPVKRRRKALFIITSLVAILLFATYLGLAIFFQSHFGFKTSINDIDASFMTAEQVDVAIADRVETYQLMIRQRENRQETIKGSSIQLVYRPDKQVDKLLGEQQPFLWFISLLKPPDPLSFNPTVSFDTAKLNLTVDHLRAMNPQSWQAPRDAYPVFIGNKYVVKSQDPGTTVDPEKVRQIIASSIIDQEAEVDLERAGCYLDPGISSTDQKLLADIDLYNRHAPFAITYTFGKATEVLDAAIAINWFSFSDEGTASLNEQALVDWVSGFAARHDSVGTERSFTTADGKSATVAGGTYGWLIDQDAEITAIKEAIANRGAQTRDPHYLQTAASHDGSEWGDTYVEINLTTQYLYYVVDGQIALESDVVTGAPWGGRSTVSGVYDVLQKSSPATLRGPRTAEGTYEWEAPVSFWMRVTWGGIGLHDATWQPRFGGDWYIYNGSHGCINMPWTNAQYLYNIVEVETPVILHY